MLREGLRNEFSVAFHKAINTKELVVLNNIKVGSNGTTQTVNVKIQRIDKPDQLNGMVMIIFTDMQENIKIKQKESKGKKCINSARELELNEELKNTREEMQSTLEEMQTSQEELKSTNEELQSTNEELTSSKEEMQSLNEELQTVNAELQSKIDDFSRVNNDMKNLLNSTDIATLFLDKDLNIRRYTNEATKIFKLIKTDVGRPFTDQVSELIYPELASDAIEVLNTLSFIKKQIPTIDGRWFSTRIMPYRTFDDRIDGLVITFFNISDLKQLESELHETAQMHRSILNLSSDIIIKLSADGEILEYNPAAKKFFEKKHAVAINQNFIQMFVDEKEQKKIDKDLNKLLKEGQDVKFDIQVIAAGGHLAVVEWNVNVLLNNKKEPTGMIILTKNATKP